jgi:hypothetical protein
MNWKHRVHSWAGGLSAMGLAIVLVTLLTALDVQAQCAYCYSYSTGNQVCGYPTGPEGSRCDGAEGGWCTECEWAYPSVPANVAPHGGLAGALALPQATIEPAASPGSLATVLRSACSGAIVSRYYTAAAALKAREATAHLVLQ